MIGVGDFPDFSNSACIDKKYHFHSRRVFGGNFLTKIDR